MDNARVIALVATIQPRRRSVERLLAELQWQSRVPDAVVLVLDGYSDEQAPKCSLSVAGIYRSATPLGPGARWRVAKDLPSNDIIVCFDDDVMIQQAPRCIEALVEAAESGQGAAGAMGRLFSGHLAPPGAYAFGDLMYAAGCGLTARAAHLTGLQALADEVKAAGGPDALGPRGDDDALVSALLWKNNVRMVHAATGNIFAAPNTQDTGYSAGVMARKEAFDAQKKEIARITGWPWRMP